MAPFGLKAPSKGTVIFTTVASVISGGIYTSYHYADRSRQELTSKVAWLSERPCGVHEMPRKVAVCIARSPGDDMEKSRRWFHAYVKPILVAGAVDYEVKEDIKQGQIASFVAEEIVKRRRLEKESSEDKPDQMENEMPATSASVPRPPKGYQKEQAPVDGIIAIGRQAWREVLTGLSHGCEADMYAKPPSQEEAKPESDKEQAVDVAAITETIETATKEEDKIMLSDKSSEQQGEMVEEVPVVPLSSDTPPEFDTETNTHFSLPPSFPPVMYVPHENIIGWTNIPCRIYMWISDYKRVEKVGSYAVAAVLDHTRPLNQDEIDVGHEEKVYWIGDDAKEILDKDTSIKCDERIVDHLKTYTLSSQDM